MQTNTDLHVAYGRKIGNMDLEVYFQLYNVFNTQTILDYNNFSELEFGTPNPDFGVAGDSGVVAGQQFTTPRQIRIGVRYEF